MGSRTVTGDVTALIASAQDGDERALSSLFTLVYRELRRLAHRRLAGSGGATLGTTDLVHEVYLKLSDANDWGVEGRAHFFSLAARAMRQIVIVHARARHAEKRGGAGLRLVDIDDADPVADPGTDPASLLRLNDALDRLAADEPRLARLVELRFFAGLEVKEIAVLESVSDRTLNRDWRRAKAQLYSALHPEV
jgi:RNA polymerase sigma factor (TIGR02999 family)